MRYRPRHQQNRRFGCLGRILTFLALIALLAYPFVEPYMLETEFVSLVSPNLPREIGQLRIVYLSDIHAGPFFSADRVQELISRINALNADLVLLGGDYAEDSDGAIEFFRNMPGIHARYGVFGVMGNHDRTLPEGNLSTLKSVMISAGVTPLVNMVTPVRIGTAQVWIAGTDDENNGWPDVAGVASQVRQDDYVIFMAHSPAAIAASQKVTDAQGHRNWFDLGLFGHTHGGQIALAGKWLGISKVEPRYEQGWITENRIDMLISRGVGTSVLPVRIGRRPQIHLITVRAGAAGALPQRPGVSTRKTGT